MCYNTHDEGLFFQLIQANEFECGNPCSVPSSLAKMAAATPKLMSLININSVN